MGPLLSAACLLDSYVQERDGTHAPTHHEWLVYPPTQATQYLGLGPLSTARKALLSVQSVIFTVNATHLIATTLAPRAWHLPQGGWARLSSFSTFACLNTAVIAGTHLVLRSTSVGLWSSEFRLDLLTTGFQADGSFGLRSRNMGNLLGLPALSSKHLHYLKTSKEEFHIR